MCSKRSGLELIGLTDQIGCDITEDCYSWNWCYMKQTLMCYHAKKMTFNKWEKDIGASGPSFLLLVNDHISLPKWYV